MKRIALLCSILMAGFAQLAQAQDVMTIGKSNPVPIVVAETASPAEEMAASELKAYIAKMTGADCPIAKTSATPAIYIGPTTLAREAIPDYDALGREEWVIKTYKGNLILAGGRPRGTLYAVYEYLERLGVVWPAPAQEYVPSMDSLPIAAIDVRDKPAFMQRAIYTATPIGSTEPKLFHLRNKMNSNYGLPVEWGSVDNIGSPNGCHTFSYYAKSDWPDEWFSMNEKGIRVRCDAPDARGQLCLTNPDLRKAMVERLREFIQKDRTKMPEDKWPRIYDISQNDWACACVCPSCKALTEQEESLSGPMIDFINAIANEIKKEYPEIMIQTFAYTWSLHAPKNIKPASNVVVRVCKWGNEADPHSLVTNARNKGFLENFKKWAALADNLAVWDYWIAYRWQFQPPYLNARNLCSDLKFYHDNHVKIMFVENESAPNTSFAQFKTWLGLKIMQNPNQDYDTLTDKFCRTYYGPAAKIMREYMEYLQERQIAADVHIDRSSTYCLPYTDRAFYEKVNALLDQAEALTQDSPVFSLNVRRERIPVDITLVNSFESYKDNLPVGTRIAPELKALFDRYAANRMDAMSYYYDSKVFTVNKKLITRTKERLELKRRILFDVDQYLPEELRGKKAVEFNWANFREKSLIDDPDAYMGHATKLISSTLPDYHRLPFKMGIYCVDPAKFITNLSIPEDKIPQDEKYHWYYLGRFEIMPKTYVWFHWTWRLQQYIESVYVKDGDNFWNVHVSVKLTGEPYVKGSKEPPSVRLDRVVLTK